MDGDRDSRAQTVRICAALFLASLLLRLPGIDSGLWFDEVWMLVDFVRKPLGAVLATYPTDNHHPLSTLLAWESVRLFGEHPWSLRLPALLFGAAGVPALYLFALRVVSNVDSGRGVALFASALLAASPHHVLFSQNARGYTALLFFSLLASEAYLARRPVRQGITLALASYAHLTGVFVVLGHLVAWAIANRPRSARTDANVSARADATVSARVRAPMIGAMLGLGLSLLLHAAMLGDIGRFYFERVNPFAAEAEWTSPLWTLAEAARSLGFGLVPGLAAISAGLAVGAIGAVRIWRMDREAACLLVFPVLSCAVALLAMGRNLWPRSFFFAAGFLLLVAAHGFLAVVDRLVPRIADGLAAGAVVVSLALLPRGWSLPKQDFAAARNFAQSARAEGEPVLTVGLASFPYEAYYGGGFTPVDSREELERVFAEGRGALVITTFPIYLRSRRPEIARFLDERGKEIARFRGSVGDGDVVVLRVE